MHWIGPMVIGIYLGILIDPRLRAWVTSKQWERQERDLAAQPQSLEIDDEMPWAVEPWPGDADSDLFGPPLSDDRT